MIVVVALLLGAIGGWARGGRIRNLEGLRITHAAAIFSLFVVQSLLRGGPLSPSWLTANTRVGLWCLCAALLIVLTLANRRIRGFLVIAVGMAMNLLVIALNGGMPLGKAAAARVGASATQIAAGLNAGFYENLSPSTRAPCLGDVIPVVGPVQGTRAVLSGGDLLMLLGVALVVAEGMVSSRQNSTHEVGSSPD